MLTLICHAGIVAARRRSLVKLCYAVRRGVFYPDQSEDRSDLPTEDPEYLKLVREAGYEAFEIQAARSDRGEQEVRDRGARLRDAGFQVAAVRAGGHSGAVASPRDGARARAVMRAAVDYAAWVGAGIVNATCSTRPHSPGMVGTARQGEQVAQGASRYASEADFVETAKRLREIAVLAADKGLTMTVEIHQGSLVDNSWSALHMLELIDMPNVGVNPDLANTLREFDTPEETMEASIVALAPHTKYWHVKNMRRIPVPEIKRTPMIKTALDDGDIDFRFAFSAMQAAGYDGYVAVEGAIGGDQLTQDIRSAEYALRLIRETAKCRPR
jgi:sugar phosphate isomerase/epimerase